MALDTRTVQLVRLPDRWVGRVFKPEGVYIVPMGQGNRPIMGDAEQIPDAQAKRLLGVTSMKQIPWGQVFTIQITAEVEAGQ